MAKSKAKSKSNKKGKQTEGSDGEVLASGEYFVEKILKAKVNVIRKDKVHWNYLVKWKGYDDPNDNTWEPPHSFKGSEHFITQFWGDADLKERDYEDPKDWVRGDIVPPLTESKRLSSSARRKSQRELSPQGEESEVEVILDQKKQESEPSSSPPPPKRGRAPRQTVLSLNKRSTRGKPPASESESSPPESPPAVSHKKRKATEEVDDPSSESDKEPPKPVSALPIKIGPPAKKKRQLKKRFTGPENPAADDPPHQDPETQPTEDDATNTPKDGSTPVIAGSPVRRQVQTGQFGSLSQEAHSPSDIPNPPEHSDKATSATPPPRSVRAPKTPQHRRRAANPRVRPMDINELPDAPGEKVDPMEHAISAKAKFAGAGAKSSSEPSTDKSQSTKRKPGPGRSSHGVASSQDDTLVNDENPQPPAIDIGEGISEDDVDRVPSQGGEITREELMDMVGLKDSEVDNLPDFNDEPMDVETEVVQTTVTETIIETIEKVPANEESSAPKASLFARPSIFGPLSIGAGSSRNLDRNVYALRLDNSVDVSVVLQDMKPGSGSGPVTTLDLKEIFSKTPSSAPGKFYGSEAGGILLGTLKTGGPCARVDLMPGEDDEHEQNWEKFRDRLENKHTFVIGAGLHILVLVASSNIDACKTVGIPDILSGLRREIIVSATDIEDVSRYSDAVDMADNSRWL